MAGVKAGWRQHLVCVESGGFICARAHAHAHARCGRRRRVLAVVVVVVIIAVVGDAVLCSAAHSGSYASNDQLILDFADRLTM